MPLRFMVSTDLPAEINSLTLSYSFMRLNSGKEREAQTARLPGIAALN